ncbi:MAG: benzoate/H(+) symporter BenE family transporter [Rhodobiaceae bacterium]|nr:benzoate/H(+) symporter BenE family transporter [Rhodobiaceae bacterium]MCC0056553.1 benzoate/H(+) symporter BenE family transporter [Rhodobiaceae bacterium]
MSRAASLTSWSSALIACIVGFGGTIALIVQALQALGASPAQTSSGITALCLGVALAGIALTVWLKMPIVLAWSTPGAALLAAVAPGLTWPQAVGAFIAAALMMVLVGIIPILGRMAQKIPASLASAMLAGVLLPFTIALFRSIEVDPIPAIVLLGVFIVANQRLPLYAIVFALLAAMVLIILRGDIAALPKVDSVGSIEFVPPVFDFAVIVSISLPLFLVTLISQNLPGLVILKTAGFEPPAGPVILGNALASLIFAPFGAHGINLAAITAAICIGDDTHGPRATRWKVGVVYGVLYLLLAAFTPFVVAVFLMMPKAVIASLTGIAVLMPLAAVTEKMLSDYEERDAAILTFAATASGVTILGIGSAFWGLVIGFATLGAKRLLLPKRGDETDVI